MKYLSALQAVSGRGCIKNGSYPVFPDSDGKVVVKETMVKARRSLRRRVSCAVIQRDADSLETIRVKWRAADTGLPRVLRSCGWGSQVILRYITDAPLESTVCFNRHQPTSSPTVFESKNEDAGENVLARTLRRFMPEEEAEKEFHELRELVKAGATSAKPSFVHNTVSSVWVARGGLDRQTVCGWCFGLQSLCEVLSTVPTGAIESQMLPRFQEGNSSRGHGGDKRRQLNSVPKEGNLRESRTIHLMTPRDRQLRRPQETIAPRTRSRDDAHRMRGDVNLSLRAHGGAACFSILGCPCRAAPFCHDLTVTKINQYKNEITATLTSPKVKMIQFQHSDNTVFKKKNLDLILS